MNQFDSGKIIDHLDIKCGPPNRYTGRRSNHRDDINGSVGAEQSQKYI